MSREDSVRESAIERVLEFKPGVMAVSKVQKSLDQTGSERPVDTSLQPKLPNHIQLEPALHSIIEGVEAETGERFFPSLVRHLAAALDVAYAFVSELNEDRTYFRTLAAWGRGAFLPNFEAPLRGTPCEAVLNGQMLHYPRDLQLLFPSAAPLVGWRAESYCGVPLFDSSGQVVGHLTILDDRPMPDGTRSLSIMRIFAARAWAEIERTRLQATIQEREKAYRDLYEQAPIAY